MAEAERGNFSKLSEHDADPARPSTLDQLHPLRDPGPNHDALGVVGAEHLVLQPVKKGSGSLMNIQESHPATSPSHLHCGICDL